MEDWRTARYLTTTGEVLVLTDYEVSNLGRFRNKKTGRILKALRNEDDYFFVNIWNNNKRRKCYIHRIVLSSFSNNVDGLLQVNHKDENRGNNCLTNLEWLTRKENNNYGTHNERVGKAHEGVFNTKKSKSVLQFDLSGNLIKEWPSMHEVERQLGIFHQSIRCCCTGKQKTAGGFVWQYK